MQPSTDTHRQFRVIRILWGILLTNSAFSLLMLKTAGLELVIHSPWVFAVFLSLLALIAVFFKDENVRLFAHTLNQFVFAGFCISIATLCVNTLDFPLIDEHLAFVDNMLGFDWKAYVDWIHHHPPVESCLVFSYILFTILIIAVICLLFLGRHSAHAQRFFCAFYVTGMATSLLSGLLPSAGTYIYYDIPNKGLGRLHEQILMGLRDHTMHSVAFPGPGIVTFPSFHAAVAVLLLYASIRLRYSRLWLMPLCTLMLFSTPLCGGHWLADVLGGMFIALYSLRLAHRILPLP